MVVHNCYTSTNSDNQSVVIVLHARRPLVSGVQPPHRLYPKIGDLASQAFDAT